MILPILNCDGCGACCRQQAGLPVSWYLGILAAAHPEATTSLPKEVLHELMAELDRWQREGFPRDGDPCFWYDAITGRCRNYEHRPDICRDEVKPGDMSCRLWRARYGLFA